MRSSALRITVVALVLIAFAAAAAFLFQSERQIAASTSALRAFDRQARDASDALGDARASEQAYVAAGQGAAFWMSKVSATADAVASSVGTLRRSASSASARAALDEAADTIAEFTSVDQRARDYLKSSQPLMAGDVIFTEGAERAEAGARQIEAARLAEHEDFDAFEARLRRQQAMAAGGAGAFTILAVLLLAPVRRQVQTTDREGVRTEAAPPPATVNSSRVDRADSSMLALNLPREERFSVPKSASVGPIMRAAADLATEFGRVRDLQDLARLLGRAADLIDASGVVVWMGNTSGGDLRPVISHGYSPQVAARMPLVPRTADNAAAAAYRTGKMQIVLSRPGGSAGAIVAPILVADGCIGAFSAEIRSGGETSETIQALATMSAAHLAAIVPAATATAAAVQSQTATA
jgi:hypothetical protein